ncbi:MAG: (Fe-S)-binding protein, partial [Chloroflexi bacterium]|nr:(Fe-S)-binding protein [Chloroflexota bacterium]
MAKKKIKLTDISKKPDQVLLPLDMSELETLPANAGGGETITPLTDEQKTRWEHNLDGISVLNLPKPKTKEEEDELVRKFLGGLEKLLSKENNWTFLLPLKMSLEYCGKCLACNEACPVFVSSGGQDIYRPTYRSEVLRRIIKKYTKHGRAMFPGFTDGNIELNWATVARLAELAYRCTLCRRCAQACVRGVDNALINHELRKLFSEEMGIAGEALHTKGTVQQLNVGASTGINPRAFADIVEFMEDDIEEKLGRRIKIPVDKKGAEVLLIHNSGEYVSWMQNPEAFAIIFDLAGIDYTLSSELGGYEGTNYG